MIPTANFYQNSKATFYTNAKNANSPEAAVYRRARAVSRHGRAGESGSGRGVAYCISRAVYRARAAAYHRLGMDSDRIRTDTNSDATIYHILFRI
jgi:hypothetical protein